MRKTYAQLDEIKKKYGIDTLWSWSRYNTYKTSPYTYFLKYIKKAKPDNINDCYSVYGGMVHELLERFYLNLKTRQELIDDYKTALLSLEVSGMKFDRNDDEKNKKIVQKYTYDIVNFLETHEKLQCKIELERFLLVNINGYYFQGYADLIHKDSDGFINIGDYKTSSIYKGSKLIEEQGQLLLYAEALHQLGVPYSKIKVYWDFLKYTNATVVQANGKQVTRQIERCELSKALNVNVTMWLKKLGYEDTMESILKTFEITNSINSLPEDVRAKYEFNDCIVYVDDIENKISELKTEISSVLSEITEKANRYNETLDDTEFYDSPELVKKQSYYFANLSEYSAKLHKPYGLYVESLEQQKIENERGLDVLFGVADNDNVTSNNKKSDLDWLDTI